MTLAAAQSPFVCDHVAEALTRASDELPHLKTVASKYVVAVLNGVLQASAAGVILKAQMSAARGAP